MKSALFICDPSWSTGNIAKCVAAVLTDWRIELHDWNTPFVDSEHDAVVCMSMTGPARNPAWRTPRMAAVLSGPGELDLPEIAELSLPENMVLAGVSVECAELLDAKYPAHFVYATPGFAHPHIFAWRDRSGPIKRAGFVGRPTTQNMQVSGPVKRPEMFSEICAAAGLEAVFSEQNYRYEDMQQFYDSVDVVISTSSREGGPFSPIEAVACGVPALSTDVGIIRDMKLPGRFETVEECVAMLPFARSLVPIQRAITAEHTRRAVAAWEEFLDAAALARLA